MGLKNFKIWGVFLVAIVVIAFMLFQQSNNNRKELEGQAIRNMELVKRHFQYAFQSHLDQILLSTEGRKKKRTLGPEGIRLERNGHLLSEIVINENLDVPTIKMKDLFVKIDQHRFFDRVFLTDTSGEVLYPQVEFGKTLPNFDKIEAEPFRLPVIKHEIIYKDESYLLYFTPVVVENMRFYLAGVIKKSYYETIGRRVDFTNLTILVYLLALMLFSMPIISLFGLQHGDKLTKFRVYNVGLSLIGIMVMLGFGFSFFKEHHPISEEKHEVTLKNIQGQYQRFINEKKRFIDTSNPEIGQYNEFFEIAENGKVKKIEINGEELNPVPDIDLTIRSYFKFFVTNNGGTGDSYVFVKPSDRVNYIGSHYSLDSAKLESVVSRLDVSNNKIDAITFYWDQSKIPYDSVRRFILFKEDGLVIHKSKKIDAPVDNLQDILSESKWKEISAIIKMNSDSLRKQTWEIPLYLDGHPYEAWLVPIEGRGGFDQPLWMIYLVDGHLEHVFSSLITLETTILLVIYLLILSLISFINKLIKPQSKYRKWDKFAYYYLFPNQKKSIEFMVMIGFFVLYSFLLVYFYNQSSFHFFAMFLLVILGSVHTKMLMYIWLGPVWGGENHNQVLVNITVLFLVLIFPIWGLYFLVGSGIFWFICFFVVGSVVGSIYFRKIITDKDEKIQIIPTDENPDLVKIKYEALSSFHNLYVCFFIMWIFLIGFIPGYVLFSKVYQYEKNHWEEDQSMTRLVEPNRFWNQYDETRRIVFGNLSSQYEPVISDFISLNRLKVQPGYTVEKSEVSFGFVGTFMEKVRYQPFLFLFISFVFIILIALTVWLIKTLTNKIYFLDFTFNIEELGRKKLKSKNMPSRIFICGLDSDLNLDWAMRKFNAKAEEIGIMDAVLDTSLGWSRDIPDRLNGKSIWFIQNIHCFNLGENLINALPWILEKAREQNVALILSSGISWKEINKQLETDALRVRFSQIFSGFYFEYVPIKSPPLKIEETGSESILLKNQRSNKAYFTNIWAELSFDEKKVCYYYSKEGFFNFSNKDVIIELIQKGVLVRTDENEMPKLFSKTFRYFVISNISSGDIAMFKKDEQKNGNVNTLQIAVFSFILLSVAMISYFDKNFLDQATTFVTGIAGAIGGIYSMFSKAIPTLKFGSNE